MVLGTENETVWKLVSQLKDLMDKPESYDHALLYRNFYNALVNVLKGKSTFPISFDMPDSLVA